MGRFHKVKRRISFQEIVALLLSGLATFWLLGVFHERGIPPKWITASLGTAWPFGVVVYMHRKWLARWTFWSALLFCLLLHCILLFTFFQFVLRGFSSFSPLLWSPVLVSEPFVLLFAIGKIERKLGLDLNGKPLRLTF
jgi:hypothetical protein